MLRLSDTAIKHGRRDRGRAREVSAGCAGRG